MIVTAWLSAPAPALPLLRSVSGLWEAASEGGRRPRERGKPLSWALDMHLGACRLSLVPALTQLVSGRQ